MQKTRKKIAIVTGTRAEYSLLFGCIQKIHVDPTFELQLIVTGSHLSKKFGTTVNEIEHDGFPIAARIPILTSSDSSVSAARSLARCVEGCAKAFEKLKPDILLVLGDRYEILGAVSAAALMHIPTAHIHGGETTLGSLDNMFRHAITHMSALHFTATHHFAQKVISMGLPKDRVFVVGAPGLDNMRQLSLLSKKELITTLGIPKNISKLALMTLHPVTTEKNTASKYIREVLKAMHEFSHIHFVCTYPNADPQHQPIVDALKAYKKRYPKAVTLCQSVGQQNYISLMKHARIMLGNSSSGIIEAATLKLPVVNTTHRQDGRLKPRNIIDVPQCTSDHLQKAMRKALSVQFKKSLATLKNPYGNGRSSEKIVHYLKPKT